jgi:4-amino-4-deoxy-L-arabinose transferase-like glycosyltransferase
VAGLYALCPLTIDQSRMVMSEPLFTTFCLVGLILAEQAVQGQRGRWWSLAMASALVLAVFTRTVGVVVIVVVLISFAASRRRSLWPGMATAAVLMIVLVGVICPRI